MGTPTLSSNARAFHAGASLVLLSATVYVYLNDTYKAYKNIAKINDSALASDKKSKAQLGNIVRIAGNLICAAYCLATAFVFGKMAITGLYQERARNLLLYIGFPLLVAGPGTWWVGVRMYNAAITTNRGNP